MSERQYIKGRLIATGKSLSKFCYDEGYTDDNPYYDDNEEWFNDYYNEHVNINGEIYQAVSEEFNEPDIYEAKRINNEEISFTVSYYDGSESFSEAIKKAVKGLT